MTQYKPGDSIGDCPGCHAVGAIIYRGGNDGICKSCSSLFEVGFDDGEKGAPPPEATPEPVPDPAPLPHTPQPVAPQIDVDTSFGIKIGGPTDPVLTDAPIPQQPEVVVDKPYQEVGQLSEVMGTTVESQKKSLRLDPSIGNDKAKKLGIPPYIMKSRPWRWAQQMCESGNPYREGSKNWKVFDLLHQTEMTLAQLVTGLEEEMGEKISYLLTIYEVVSQCVAAGLLIIDPETRMIGKCKGQPQPTKLP